MPSLIDLRHANKFAAQAAKLEREGRVALAKRLRKCAKELRRPN